MNFKTMPELNAPNGYAIWWAVSLSLSVATVYLFSRYGLYKNFVEKRL